MNYGEYEKELEEFRKGNQKYMDIFQEWLDKETETKDVFQEDLRADDLDLFLNYFLPQEECFSLEDGCRAAAMFFGVFLQTKVSGIGVSDVYRMSTTLRMFYGLMVEKGFAREEYYNEMLQDINENIERWLYECEKSIYHGYFDDDNLDYIED